MPSSAAQPWLDKAAEDELVVSLITSNAGPWALAAYHVQQAAEKYVKAALIESGIAPPKSHDLTQLIGLHPEGASDAGVSLAASMTSAYAWLTRYPGVEPITESDVRQAEGHLATIKAWALSVVS